MIRANLFRSTITYSLSASMYAAKPRIAEASMNICSAPSPISIPKVNSTARQHSQNSASNTASVLRRLRRILKMSYESPMPKPTSTEQIS